MCLVRINREIYFVIALENEDVVGAAPTGDAPTSTEWSTILSPTDVRLILEVWRYLVLRLL